MTTQPGSTAGRDWPHGSRKGAGDRQRPGMPGSPVLTAYSRRRAILTAAGRWQPWADPQPVREHVTRLRQGGGSYSAIAAAAGVGAMTVHAIAHGHGRISTATAAALLPVDIARAIGGSDQTLQKITRGNATTISPHLRDAVTAIYDAWWDKRAPERTRGERAAASAARRRAMTGNWCAGAGMDDDQLDVPGYRPAWGWLPATGTGVATDIHLPEPDTQAGIA